MASSVEFVRIAGYPVKVTSLARDEGSGGITLVVITRGSADRNHLNELLATSPLTLEIPQEPPKPVSVEEVDSRAVGKGEQVITRFSIRFGSGEFQRDGGQAERAAVHSVEDRLEAIERKLDRALDALAVLTSANRTGRR